jgi:hypothetical protein
MIPEPNEVALIIATAMKAKSDTTPRTLQSRAGLIGPSDLGFCRNKAALMGRGIGQTDSKSTAPADIGTAIHHWVEDALRTAFPTWLIEERFSATFPCGAEVAGSADLAITEWNALLDIKTVDGFEKIKRFGPSLNHKMQRHTYALGAIQAGRLDDSQTVYVGNVYIDRSGVEPLPYVIYEEFDHAFTDEIDAWITDVIYAIQHDEAASQDIAAPICEKICEYYTACRGGLPIAEPTLITDEETKNNIRLYIEGREMEKTGKKMKDEARVALADINGSDGEWTVRWTQKAGYDYAAGYRAPSQSIDIVRSR